VASSLFSNVYANQELAMYDQDTLDEVIRRIVEVVAPEKIILFGSAARGDMTRHSDLDLLIIKEGGDARLRGRIHEGLYGVRVPVDAILVSPADVERYKNSHALVIKPALKEGRVVYEAS
jgi:predicted nucleotidyltransferase